MGSIWVAAVVPSQAVRPDEANQPRASRVPEAHRRDVSADQGYAARAAQQDGVTVEWQSRLGTPRQVRGQDLGRRRLFLGGRGLSVKASGRESQDAIAVLDNLTGLYGIRNAAEEFAARQPERDRRGAHHIRVQQVYRGLRVIGGEVLVHFDADGSAREVNGTYVADITIATEAKLTGEEALKVAATDQAALGNPVGKTLAEPELVVFAHRTAPRLAYEITLTYDAVAAGPGRWRYWIDAVDGTILLAFNDIKRVAAPSTDGSHTAITGSLLTGEGGAVTSVTGWRENSSGYYYLYNTNRHWLVYNVATSGSYVDLGTYAYRNGTANWGTSDRAEMSAAAGFDDVQDYFSTVHARSSFDDANGVARANVHQGVNYVNAYWDGLDFHIGDGDGSEANPLGVLDICGHEFTHAVTDYSAALYYDGESGALNESISDIFGTCVEFHTQPDGRSWYPNVQAGQADWLCGEDAWISQKALRDLRCPSNTATVGAGNEQPTKYLGTYWYSGSGDNGGVHVNSGVQNFFFYLLCEGGSGNNDGITYSVAGIGITNAEQVAYLALTAYMSQYTDYEGARDAWVSAATNLNPAWSTNVEAAWAAVGVGPAPNTVAAPQFSPPEDSYVSAVTVTISTVTADALIYYTLNGTDPSESSALYTNAVTISSNTTVKAKAYKSGMIPSAIATARYSFLGSLLHFFPMDTSPGWTISGGQWAFGVPLGGGGAHGSPDPTNGFTGINVYGYNLSGDYANSLSTTYWLTTTPLNLSTSMNCKLVFYRWLGVEQSAYDHAYVDVSNNGTTWTRIWANSAEVTDASWTRVVLDISSVADQKNAVSLRWGMGRTDGSWTYCGWNIDDVAIWGTVIPQPPMIQITTPTAAATYAATSSTITVAGIASDDGAVAEVVVGNSRAISNFVCSGTTSWHYDGLPLYQGTNYVSVIATDNAGLQSTDTLVVVYAADTVYDDVLRSGALVQEIVFDDNLTPGDIVTVQWKILSYVPVRCRVDARDPAKTWFFFRNGTYAGYEESSFNLYGRHAGIYSFECSWPVPQKSGDTNGMIDIWFNVAQMDGDQYMMPMIPDGVDSRPHPTASKVIQRKLLPGGDGTAPVSDTDIWDSGRIFETAYQHQERSAATITAITCPDNISSGALMTCEWKVLSYLPVDSQVLLVNISPAKIYSTNSAPLTGSAATTYTFTDRVSGQVYGATEYTYRTTFAATAPTGTVGLCFRNRKQGDSSSSWMFGNISIRADSLNRPATYNGMYGRFIERTIVP